MRELEKIDDYLRGIYFIAEDNSCIANLAEEARKIILKLMTNESMHHSCCKKHWLHGGECI